MQQDGATILPVVIITDIDIAHPGIRAGALHHTDTLGHVTAIEVVGKGIGGVGQSLAHQQGLIGHLRDALVQHVVVGLILMHITQTGA